MASTATSLAPLAGLLRDGENVISPYVRDSDEPPVLGALAGSGPRAAEAPDDYTLLVEAIREGYLLHYETPRLVQDADPDLRLLAGDYLYALGLERLAARLSAQVHAENGHPSPRRDAGGLWLAATVAVAAGSTPEHERAKEALRSDEPDAAVLLLRSAADGAHRAGLDGPLALAAESVGFAREDFPDRG